jgi:hypothetical protein
MAEPIGELDVQISGDYSELQDAISQAQDIATQGASDIADAFDKPDLGDSMVTSLQGIGQAADDASTQVDSFGTSTEGMGTSLDGLSTALSDTSDAASSMGGAIGDAGDAAGAAGDAASGAGAGFDSLASSASDASTEMQGAGSSAEEAEGGLAGMAEQLTAIGEALVITEGLKEFGQEALNAYGTVQSVTIGLTALTGSAEKADEVIEQIKNLAATEPFAFPEIAPTVQKMVALGVSTEQIPTVMQAAADASAATGNQFGQVANMLDRMSLSGTANARSMATLGISTTDLGKAMGVTADEATAAFKALDQSQRVDVLAAALSKFAGTAIAEAQGISGQWQIFQNQFEEVMVAVGQDIAPAISGILAFGKAVLSGIQTAAEAFGSLPKPVQDVIVAFGLLAGAAVPVTAGLAAIGIGLNGLGELIPAVTGLFGALGVAEGAEAEVATESAAAHTAAATAMEAEGVAAETAATEVGAAGLATGEAATAFGLAGTAATVLEAGLIALGAAIVAVDFKNVASDVGELGATLKGLVAPGTAAGDVMWTVQTAANAATGSSDTLKEATAGVSAVLSENLRGALMEVIPGLDQEDAAVRLLNLSLPVLGDEIADITHKWGNLPAPLQASANAFFALNEKLSLVGTGFEALAPSVQKVIDEVNKQNTAAANAQQAYNTLNAALQSNKTLSDGTVVTQQMVDAALLNVVSATNKATDAIKTHTAATGAMKDSYASVETEASALVATFDAASAALLKVTAAQDGSLQQTTALVIAQKNYDAASKAINGDLQQQTTASNSVATAMQAIYDKTSQATGALQTAIQVYNQIRQATIEGTASQAAYNVAWNNLVSAFQAANPQMVTAKSTIADVGAAAMKAAQADDSWTGSHGNLITVMKNGTSTQVDVATYAKQIGDNSQGAVSGVDSLSSAHHSMVVMMQTDDGWVAKAVDAVTSVGTSSEGAVKPIQDLGAAVGHTDVQISDYSADLLDLIYPIQQTDQFDTSMIKVTKDTSDADSALQNYGQTIINADGTITNLTDLLKKLADEWEQVANSTNDATNAQNGYNQAASQAPGGSGGKGSKDSAGYLESLSPQETQLLTDVANQDAAISGFVAPDLMNDNTGGLGYNGNNTLMQQGLGGTGVGNITLGYQVNWQPSALQAGGAPAGGAPAGTPSSPVSVQDSDVKASLVTLSSAVGNSAEQFKANSAAGSAQAAALLEYFNSGQQAIQQSYAPGGSNYGGPAQTAGSLAPIYMTDASGNLLVSTDGGATWSLSSGSSTGLSSPITGLDPLTTSLTNLTSAATTASTAVNTVVDQAGTAGLAPTSGNVWNGSQSNPATGEPGTPMYTVTGTGTAASPFQWVPTGQVYAGTTNTQGLTQIGPAAQLTGSDLSSLQGLGISQQALNQIAQSAGMSPQDYLDIITNEPLYGAFQSTNTITQPTGLGGSGTPSTFYAGGQNLSSADLQAITAMGMSQQQFSQMAAAAGMSPSDYLYALSNPVPEAGFINTSASTATAALLSSGAPALSTNPQGLTEAQIEAQQTANLANPLSQGASQNQMDEEIAGLTTLSDALTALTAPTSAQSSALTALTNQLNTLKAENVYTAPAAQTTTLTAAQLQALINNPGVGNGAVPAINISLTINNPQLSTPAQVQTAGTQLVNQLRSMASQLKYV